MPQTPTMASTARPPIGIVLRLCTASFCLALLSLFCSTGQAVEPSRFPAVTKPVENIDQITAAGLTRPAVTFETMIVAKKPGEHIAAYCTLSAPVSEQELGLLAGEAFEHLQGDLYKYVAINWYLPDQRKGEKPWGVSNFGEGETLVVILDGKTEQPSKRSSIPKKYLPKSQGGQL